jgi:hypothetical protein
MSLGILIGARFGRDGLPPVRDCLVAKPWIDGPYRYRNGQAGARPYHL